MRLTAMGDVAMTAPIVASVCKANPDVHFTMLSTTAFEPVFEQLPNFTFFGTNIRKEKGGVSALWRLFHRLKNFTFADGQPANFDTIIDLHDVLRTMALRNLFRLRGAKVYHLDKGRSEKRELVNGANRRQLTPTTERYKKVFRDAGLVVPDEMHFRTRPHIPQAMMAVAAHRADEMWIGISPFAQHRAKMYDSKRMIKVLEMLLAKPGVRVFIFGGGAVEAEAVRVMMDGATNGDSDQKYMCHNAINVMPLADEMALMANLDCMISMDSSNMHLCSIFGVRVVSLWGGTHPYAGFLGYGQKEEDVVQRHDVDCRPCSVFGNIPCRLGDYHCFDIKPEAVVDRVFAKR